MARVSPASYSVYAPLRYEITRPFAKKLSQRAASQRFLHGNRKADEVYHDDMWRIMRKSTTINFAKTNFATNESKYLTAYSSFYDNGRIIYDFSHKLISALISTDSNKIPLSTLKFPAKSFYMHFGDMAWPSECPIEIEGVYVHTFMNERSETIIQFQPIQYRMFSFPFYMETGVDADSSCFIVRIGNNLYSIDDYIKEEQASLDEQMDEMRHFEDSDKIAKFFGFTGINPEKNAMIAKTVINCLLYLKSVPDDIEKAWEDRAPHELVQRAILEDSEGNRNSANRTLLNQDYLKINLIGKKFYYHDQSGHGQSSKKATHLRRGHFKNQAYGHEWSEHRVIYVPPVLVNPENGEVPGRIYKT